MTAIAIPHILLRSEWLARDLLQELHLGASFEDLAAEHSACASRHNQGFAGYHHPDHLPPNLAQALMHWHGPHNNLWAIKTAPGFHLVRTVILPPCPLV